MPWKTTPDDSKSLVITAKGVPPVEPPVDEYKPPPPKKEPNWFAQMRAWMEGIVGRDLPESPLEKL